MATSSRELTQRQSEVLDAIVRLTNSAGHAPTTRELAAELGIRSSAVHGYLTRLRALGMVDWAEGKARTLRVIDAEPTTTAG